MTAFKTGIHRFFLIYLILISLLVGLSIAWFWIASDWARFREDVAELRVDCMEEQKALVKREVESALSFIAFMRSEYDTQTDDGAGLPDLQKKCLEYLSGITFGKNGYIFSGRYDGVSTSGPQAGENMYDMKDRDGVKFVQEFIRAAKSGGGFVQYALPAQVGKKHAPKLSYAAGVPDWEWYIGAGVYLEDLDALIAREQSDLNRRIRGHIKNTLLVFFSLLVFIFIIARVLSHRLKKNLTIFTGFFKRAASDSVKIDVDALSFSEFQQLAESANDMVKHQNQAEEALRKSEKRFRDLAEMLPEAVFETDLNMNFVYANRQAYAMSGYSPEDFEKGINCLLTIAAEDRERARASITARLRGEKLEAVEYLGVKKDGTSFPILIHAAPILLDGEAAGLRGIIMDLTVRKRAEAAIQESEAKLARLEKMESLGMLAGGVAHDLNNILSGITSLPELILMDLPNDSRFREPIESMRNSGQRAVDVVQDLLTVARGAATPKAPLLLNDVIQDYLVSHEYGTLAARYPAIAVRASLHDDLFAVMGSSVHIRKAAMNLITNAMEAVGGKGNVIVSTENRYLDTPLKGYDHVSIGEYAVLSVSDNGPGIKKEDLDKIFEPFYTKKTMGRSGTGLGLTVVWNVVKDHKGYIDVSSDPMGTTFHLFFPITRSGIPVRGKTETMESFTGNGEKLLIVDDEPNQRKIFSAMLSHLGYRAHAVSSGEEAEAYLKTNTADLILLDMIMEPGINGRETYERVLKIQPCQKALIVSGFAETEDVRETLRLGAGKHLAKPVSFENLGIAIREELKIPSLHKLSAN